MEINCFLESVILNLFARFQTGQILKKQMSPVYTRLTRFWGCERSLVDSLQSVVGGVPGALTSARCGQHFPGPQWPGPWGVTARAQGSRWTGLPPGAGESGWWRAVGAALCRQSGLRGRGEHQNLRKPSSEYKRSGCLFDPVLRKPLLPAAPLLSPYSSLRRTSVQWGGPSDILLPFYYNEINLLLVNLHALTIFKHDKGSGRT